MARFELFEALRSRLMLFVVLVYAAGAAFGASLFLRAVEEAEEQVREQLVEKMGIPAANLPPGMVRDEAVSLIARGIEDESLRKVILGMDPLALFYGYVSLNLIGLLVLVLSAGAHAADLDSGASRFVLFRVDRLSWAAGKAAGQASLVAVGLTVGALVTGLVGWWIDEAFEWSAFVSLGRASLSTWIYGLSYLGLFSGVSLIAKTPLRARALGFGVLFTCGVGHLVLSYFSQQPNMEWARVLRWLLPGQYEAGLWHAAPGKYLSSVLGLLLIGGLGFTAGARAFQRRDA